MTDIVGYEMNTSAPLVPTETSDLRENVFLSSCPAEVSVTLRSARETPAALAEFYQDLLGFQVELTTCLQRLVRPSHG